MSFFRGFVFVFLMGSSFFVNANTFSNSYPIIAGDTITVNYYTAIGVLAEQQADPTFTAPIHSQGDIFNDLWTLEVLNDTKVDIAFSAPEIGNLFSVTGFDIIETSPGVFIISDLLPGTHLFNVQGEISGVLGSTYVAATTVAAVAAIPVPAAIWLFSSAFLGLISFNNRRKTVLPA